MSIGFGKIPVIDPFLLTNQSEKLNSVDFSKLSDKEKKAKLKLIASQFEEIMINTLLKTSTSANKVFSKGDNDNYGLNMGFYKEMNNYYLSQSIVAEGGLGLQDLIVEQLMDKLNQNNKNIIDNKNNLIKKGLKFNHEKLSFSLPVKGRISSDFGWRIDPFDGKRRFHNGVDIAAPEGTPVKSVETGKVIFAGREKGYGNLIILEHINGYKTYYAHLKEVKVKKGDIIGKNEIIGNVGMTGRATGPHLHFEIRKGGYIFNPEEKVLSIKFMKNLPIKRTDGG
jgi:murein DD-endopeptidase MepM/ murein hydrolase activator NlpD